MQAPPAVVAECGATAYDCALFHVGRHEFAAAVGYLDRQLAAAPRDLKALNLLGIALTGAGRRDAANERFWAALAIDPTFTPALKNLAINEYDAGRLAAAQGHLEQVLKLAPADEIANLYLAEIHYAAKRRAPALAHYEKSGRRFAQDPRWTLHYGLSLLDAGRKKEAAAVLERLPEADGASLFEAGVAFGQAAAHAEAARFFGAARKSYRDAYAAGFNETLMRIEAGDNEGAIRVAQELMSGGNAPAELYNLVARAYERAGRVREAYDALRQATRLEPKAPDNYVDLAMICVEHTNFDLGLEIVDIGLRQLPDSWVLYIQRGVLLAMKGLLGEAEKAFDTARRLAPDQAVPYAALGMAWIQSGQTDKAVETLRGALPRRQDHIVPYIFAVALLRSGVEPASPAGAEAVEALRASIKANPRFAPARAELGRLLLKRDSLDLAVKELETAAELDPAGTPALYALAQAYRRRGDAARAQEMLARVSKLNAQERGDDPDGELRRAVVRIVREGTAPARTLGDSGQTEAPVNAFREAARPDAGGAEAQFHLGVDLDRQGRAQEAVAAYQTALRLKPDFVEARYGLSVVSAKLGDLDGTIRLLREVTERAPGLADAHYDLGVYLGNRYRAGRGLRRPSDLDEAERELRKAVELDAAQPKHRRALGQLLAERQRLDEAVGELRQAAKLAGDDPSYAYDLGLALRMLGDLDGAEAQLRAAIAGDPKHGDARRALGLILRQKGDLDAAARELRLSVAEQPGDAQARNVLGSVLLKLGDLDGAIEELRQATRLDPALTEAYVNLGQALMRAGRKDEARAALADVQRLKEQETGLGRAMVLVEMAATRLEKGDAATAVDSLRDAVAASPDFAEAHYQLGRALRRAAAPAAEVEDAFLRAVRLDPGHGAARYEWARQLAARGDPVSAEDQLRQAVELQPSLVDAHRERARIAQASGDWATAVAELDAVLAWEPSDPRARSDLAAAVKRLDPKRP